MAAPMLVASMAAMSSAPDDFGSGALSTDQSAGVGEPDASLKLKRVPGMVSDVYSWFEITLKDIDVPSQMFQASVEIHCFWQDYNLPNIFPNYADDDFIIHDDYVPIKMTEIFENKTDLAIMNVDFEYYDKTGTIYMLIIVECTFVERMELQRFPLDRQFMNMEFNALTKPVRPEEGNWNWILEWPDWMPEEQADLKDKKFAVRMLSSITEYELLDPWVDFNKKEAPFSIRLRVNRLPSYYFGNIVFPNFLIIAGCFSAFAVERDEVADRLSVTVTLMLAAVAFRFVVTTMLPKVSYLTIMDYYLLMGFVALIVMILEHAVAAVGAIDEDIREMIDIVVGTLFAVVWIVSHIVALAALLFKDFLRLTWEEMDAIDSADDEESEFLFADPEYVKGKPTSKACDDNWEKFKEYNAMERANLYSKEHGIKRSNTFQIQYKAAKRKQSQKSASIYDEKQEKVETVEKVEIYVAPKNVEKQSEKQNEIAKAKEKAYVASNLANSIELSTPQDAQEKEKLISEEKEVVKDENDGDGDGHGYNDTVVVNPSADAYDKVDDGNDGSDGSDDDDENDENEDDRGEQGGMGKFVSAYKFDSKSVVIMKHYFGKTLRIKPKNEEELNENGGKGKFARWIVELDGEEDGLKVVKFKSKKSGKYLRILKNAKEINANGSGGKWTRFKVHVIDGNQVKLESVEFNGKYVAVKKKGVSIGKGGKFCKFTVFCKDNDDDKDSDDDNDGYTD